MAAPVITGVSPTLGPLSGGTVLTVTGSGLNGQVGSVTMIGRVNPTAGNALLLMVGLRDTNTNGTTVSTVTDTRFDGVTSTGNVWTRVGGASLFTANPGVDAEMYLCLNCTGGGTQIKVTATGNTPTPIGIVMELNGIASGSAIDQVAFATGASSGTTTLTSSGSTTQNNEIAIGMIFGAGTQALASGASGYTMGAQQISNVPVVPCTMYSAYNVLSASGVQSLSGVTWSSATRWVMGLVTLKAPATPSSTKIHTKTLGNSQRGPGIANSTFDDVVHSSIIEIHWGTTQPNGQSTNPAALDTSKIDSAVSAVRAWNNAPANAGKQKQTLRARIECGIHCDTTKWTSGANAGKYKDDTPVTSGGTTQYTNGGWIYALEGTVFVQQQSGANTGYIPQWWTKTTTLGSNPVANRSTTNRVLLAWDDFCAALAAYIDPIPEIVEVTYGLTMEIFGEVFIRFDSINGATLKAAGMTSQNDLTAMMYSLASMAQYFQKTRVILDVNTYQAVDGPNVLTGSWSTQTVMDFCTNLSTGGNPPSGRITFPAGLTFTNASLDTSGNGTLYNLMQSYGPNGTGVAGSTAAISFQTMPTLTLGSQTQTQAFQTVYGRAVGYGASSLELPQGYQSLYTHSVVAACDTALQANA